MNWEKPNWYVTPEEFAELVVQALEQTNHFNRNEPGHPEDIVIAFTSHAEAVALGMGAAGRKMYQSEKQAIMKPKDLKKLLEESHEHLDDDEDYSESKWKAATAK
jgi:hypothetical protein